MELSSPTIVAIERTLDGFSARHAAIANNIANVNTPGYVKQEVNFEQSLVDALAENAHPIYPAGEGPMFDGLTGGSFDGFSMATNSPGTAMSITDSHNNALLSWQPVTSDSPDGPQRLDGNRTPVETEMSGMAANAVKYNAVSSIVAKEFQLLRTLSQAK